MEHIASARTEDSGRLCLDGLRVEEVDLPAALIGTLGDQGRAAFEQHVAALQQIVVRSGATILPSG